MSKIWFWFGELPDCDAFAVFLIKPLPDLLSFVVHNAACVLAKIDGISILIQGQNIDTVKDRLLT